MNDDLISRPEARSGVPPVSNGPAGGAGLPGAPPPAPGPGRAPRASGFGSTLTSLAIGRPLFMLMAITAVLIFGAIGYARMGVDLFPAVNFPVVLVTVPYPGASPEVVESLVTKPVEDSVAGLADLDQIQSYSSEGLATITVQFKDSANADTAAIEVEKRVNAARASLPADVQAPTILKFDFNQQPIITLALSGDRSPEQLYRLADERLRNRLETQNGVGQVSIFGGQQREVQVNVDPARLRAYGLTLQQVTQALGAENIDLPGGQVQDPRKNYNLRVDAKFRSPGDIEGTVVSSLPSGGQVRIRDVATVVDGFKDQTLLARVNGEDAVGITVTKQATANVTNTATAVKAEVGRLQQELPEGTTLEVITDNSVFIRNSLNGVQRTLIEAILLTGLVLLFFLHSWRSTIIVLLAIPTSLIATFGTMWLQGFTLNFLTALALTLTIGILVDDSIVVLENIFRHLQRGEPPRVAAVNGRAEIGLAAIAITLVDVVVFAPVGLLSGQIGQFFRQFGFTVVAATLFSLLVSFTLTPLLASRWLRAEDEHGTGLLAGFSKWWERGFARLERGYERLLRWALNFRWVVVGGALLALVAGIALPATGIVKTEFFPAQDEGTFTLFIEMPPGTNLETTQAAAVQVEQQLLKVPEVETVMTRTGQGEQLTSQASRFAQLDVNLIEKSKRQRTAAQVGRASRVYGENIPGMTLRPGVPSAGGGSAQPIQLRIFGTDLATLNRISEESMAKLKELGTLEDLTNSGVAGAPEYVVRIDRRRAADLGLTASQVAQTVRTAYAGSVATKLQRENSVGNSTGIDVRVQLTDDTRESIDKLNAVPLLSPSSGGQVTLGQIATITPAQGPSQIQRQDRQRVITIGAGIAEGAVLGDVTGKVDATMKEQAAQWPAGYRFTMGGESEQQQDTFVEFGNALMLSIVLMYMLLVALYESLLYPLIVIFALPLALVGAMGGLAIGRETLNLFSLIGVIMLTGLVGKNSILVVDLTNNLRRQGLDRRTALLTAGPARLRPILMTSAALIFAQIPLVLKLEEGSELNAPLGWVVMGGMATSTLLALVFVPAMYTIIDDFQNLILRLFRRGKGGPKKEGNMDDGIRTPDEPAVSPDGRSDGQVDGQVDGQTGNGRPKKGGAVPVGAATMAIGGLLVGGLLLSGCGLGGEPQTAKAAPAPPPMSVAVTDVKQQDLKSTYDASGTAEAVSQISVLPETGGKVTRLDAEVGQRVRAGQLLAELDHATQDAQVAQAEAALAAAQAKLAQVQRGARSEDVTAAAAQRDAALQQAGAARAQAAAAASGITTADAQIQAAQQSADAAQQQANAAAAQAATASIRLEALKNPRPEDLALLQSQVDLARVQLAQAQSQDEAVAQAQNQVEQARVALQQAQDGNRPEAIRAAQAQLDTAQSALTQLQDKPVREEDIEVARLNVEAAEAAWRTAQEAADKAGNAYSSARDARDHLPGGFNPASAQQAVAQAESARIQADAQVQQAVIQRDQAKATYNKVKDGPTAWDLRQAQLQVEAARAQLDLTKNPDPARVRTAQLAVEQAQLQLQAQRKQIGFQIQQAQEGVKQAEAQQAKVATPGPYDVQQAEEAARAAQAQADAAAAQASAASSQVDAARAQRGGAEAQASAATNQANAAQAQARGAEAQLAKAQVPFTSEDLQGAQAGVQQALAALDLARTQRDDAFITAPVDGLISAKSTTVGAMVGPQAPIATLVSDAVEIAVPVEEAQFPTIRPGQAVTITTPAYPGETFTGSVISISPSGDTRSRSFTARLRPDDPLGKLRPGMYLQVSIATAEKPAVPVVPRDSLLQRQGQTSVFVIGADNKAVLRPVQTGILTGSTAEIVQGLQPGEKVVVVGGEDLQDGQAVAPQPFSGTIRP
jgi:HAE1 family hydrophobic/amphiphilic exporter-1